MPTDHVNVEGVKDDIIHNSLMITEWLHVPSEVRSIYYDAAIQLATANREAGRLAVIELEEEDLDLNTKAALELIEQGLVDAMPIAEPEDLPVSADSEADLEVSEASAPFSVMKVL